MNFHCVDPRVQYKMATVNFVNFTLRAERRGGAEDGARPGQIGQLHEALREGL